MMQTPGSRSDLGPEYMYKIITYVAASLTQNSSIKDFVIYSKLKNFGEFDCLILKLWFKEENLPYVYLAKIRYQSGKPRKIDRNLIKYENSFKNIIQNKNNIHILQDIPTANIMFWFFCNNNVEENTRTESTYNFISLDQTDNITVPFKLSTGSCYQIRLSETQTHREFLDKFNLFLNLPNIDEIEGPIAKICDIVESADITDYVSDYYKVQYLFTCGLTKTNFEMELLQIHLRNYIVKPTKIVDAYEEQAHIWNELTMEHQLTIVDNVPDIRRILFGCFVHKINKLFNCVFNWDDCLYNQGQLDEDIIQKAAELFLNNPSRQWLSPPETIKSLIDYLWICNELPLILKIYEPLPILAKYKHINKRFVIINGSKNHSKEIGSPFSNVFTNVADIHIHSLRNELLRNIQISLQGRIPVSLYDIIGSDQNCMKTLTSSEILHLIRKRKIYLEERCLDEVESTVFIIQDENSNTDKNSNILEADDNGTIVINCKSEEREWYIKHIEEQYKQHSICCLRSVDRMLEFIEGDMHALRRYFIDNCGGYILCVGKDRPIPIIGQRLDNKPQVYIPRYLRKAIIPNSVFKIQERRICLLSGDIDSLEFDIKQQLIKEDVDYNADTKLRNNQNVFISDQIQSPDEYWEKFSWRGYPLFHVNVVNGCMELVNYRNCSNMSSYVSYSKEAFVEEIFYKEITSKLTIISGEPGIGKSSLLCSLSEATDKNNYVLFCNLVNYRKDLTLDNEKLFGDPLDYIFKKYEKITDKGLLYSLYKYHKSNNRLTVFIDSFDELLPMHKKSLLLFMKAVVKSNNQIIVASRFSFDKILIDNFEVQPVKVANLKEADYTTYFESKSMLNININDIPVEFLISPLFLTFLCFFYREDVVDLTQISKFDLFKNIIMKKIERYYHKTKQTFYPEITALTNDVLRMHRQIALAVVFGKDLVIELKIIKNYEKLVTHFEILKMRLGIVKGFNDGYAVFSHQTFAEFLAAEWLYETLLDNDFELPNNVQTIYEKMLLECDINVRYMFDNMVSAKFKLHKAILEGNLNIVKQLIDEDKRNLTQVDKCGRNALILSASYCYDKNYEILEEVVAKSHACGIDFFECDFFMKWNWLHYLDELSKDRFFDQACNYNLPATIAKYLSYKERMIGSGHISNAYQNNNLDVTLALSIANSSLLAELFIPVMKNAIERGRLDVACDLIVLKYKCNIFGAFVSLPNFAYVQEFVKNRTYNEFTALHLACMLGNQKAIKALVDNNTDLYAKDIFGNIPLYYAIIHGKVGMFKKDVISMAKRNQTGSTFLHLACTFLKKDIVELLLFDHIIPANEKNSKGETPLHAIACMDWPQVIENEVRNMTNASVEDSITYFDQDGHIFDKIVMRAQRVAKLEHLVSNAFHKNVILLIEILLNFGLDATEQDKKGNTALHLAYQHNNKVVVEYLIKKFDEIAFIKGENGLSVFEIAKRDRQMDIVNYIWQHTSKLTPDEDTGTDRIICEYVETSIKRELKHTGQQKRTFLHTAAINGRSDIILFMLEKGFPIDARDDGGYTPLHFVKSARDAQLFLGKFINIEDAFQKSNNGETPLCTACRSGYLDVVKFLLSLNTDLVNTRNKYEQTPLHLSAMANNLDVAVILLNNGANVNDIDASKSTALHLVIPNGSISFVETFLENNANMYLQDNFGNTALHLACRYGQTKLVERLIKESSETIDICNAVGYKAHDIACIEGNCHVVSFFVKNITFEVSNTILHKIVKMGHLHVLKILLESKIISKNRLECRDNEGNTLLHLAALRNHSIIMQLLLKYGLQPNALNDNGETPLHLVQSAKCAEIVLSAYRSGSNSFSKTKFDETPLHRAVCVNVDLVQILLNANADVSGKDCFGWTPLHIATWANKLNIVRMLLQKGANVNETNDYSSTALHIAATRNLPMVQILLNAGAKINAIYKCKLRLQQSLHIQFRPGKNEQLEEIYDQTVLDIACMHGKYDIIQYLFRNYDEIREFNVSKATVREVISKGDLKCLEMLFDQQVLPKDYLERSNRYKYLHMAVAFGHEDVVSFLIKKDNFLEKNNRELKSAFMYAIAKDYVGIVKIFLEKTEISMDSIDEEMCALTVFIIRNNIELVSLLLNRNSNLNNQADIVHTALHCGSLPVLEMLIKDETDFNIKDEDDHNSLEYILLFASQSRITYLLSKYPRLKRCTVSRNVFFTLVKDGKVIALEILFKEKNLTKSSLKCTEEIINVTTISNNSNNILLFLYTLFDQSNRFDDGLTDLQIPSTLSVQDYLDLKDEKGNTPLHLATIENHIDIVRFLIEKGSNVNAINNISQTSLHLAVKNNNIDIIRVLLQKGANVDATEINFATALHIAASTKFLPILKTLLIYGANTQSVDKYGNTALHITVAEKQKHGVRILIENGAKVNATNNDFQTPLHIAVAQNFLMISQILLNCNAYIESINKNGFTALHVAVIKNNILMVRILLERGANINAATIDFKMSLRTAPSGSLLHILKLLLDYSDKSEVVALQNAIRILVGRCVNVNINTNTGPLKNLLSILKVLNCNTYTGLTGMGSNKTLHFKVMKNDIDIKQVIFKKCAEVNSILTSFDANSMYNAEIQIENMNGQTALHFAVVTKNIGIIKLLLAYGANVNATNSDLRTPLHFAVLENMESIVEMLLQYAVDTQLADANGHTALHLAVFKKHINIVQLLINYGSSVNAPDNSLLTALHVAASLNLHSIVKVLLDHNADIQLANVNGLTALHLAVTANNIIMVQLLLDRDADVNASTIDFETPLHIAVSKSLLSIIEVLINFNANLQLTNKDGNTPLHLAYAKGNIRVIELLIKFGAKSISMRNLDGHTPFEFGCINGTDSVLKILFDHAPVVEGENISTNALHNIVERGRLTTLKLLFDGNVINKEDLEKSLLHIATMIDHVDIVNFLIDRGVKVNASGVDGFTPLHLARSVDAAKVLLKKSTNIANAKSQSGRTPLHIASQNGYVKIIQLLLDVGAEISVRDTCGWSPLLLAAIKNRKLCVKILLDSGADVNEMNNLNQTALHLALQNNTWDLITLLLGYGANVHIKDWNGNTSLHSMMIKYRWYTRLAGTLLYNWELPKNNVIDLIYMLIQHVFDLSEINGDQEWAKEIVENLKLEKVLRLESIGPNASASK